MNITPLTVNSFTSDQPDANDDPLFDYFLGQSFSIDPVPNPFAAGAYEYQEEAFDMQKLLLDAHELTGGISPNPLLPNVVSMDVAAPLAQLKAYTNNLYVLAAPAELCIQKALELISSRALYEINVEAFRMELVDDQLNNPGVVEINALIKGICCIADYILAYFDNLMQSRVEFFPYEFYQLRVSPYGTQLFLLKVVADASIPTFRPATVVRPAYSYPEVQATVRADYITKADQCLII
jgi:hypothetical protein